MASSTICWGIEIGAAAIKAVKLEAVGDGGVRLLEYANIVHPKPLSTPDVNPNDILRVSLGALTSQHDLTKAAIAVSVPGHAAFARFAKLPPVEPKKVPDIVKFEAMQQIPFPLEQVEWDYQTFVSPDAPDVEVGIFAITREKVMERLQMLDDVGITPNFVVLSPIGVYNALAYDLDFDSKTPGTIIVDVGTTSTDLVIATPGRMWIRTFPIGGHQFTEALVSQFQLSYPKAEKLKREAEDSKHARQVFQAMRPVFTNLAQDIQRSIGYYQSLNRDANLTRLIGIGSTFRLPGLRKYLKQQLSMDVYRIEEFKKLKVTGDNAVKFDDESLNLATAYGLALQGLGLNSVGCNLMPVSVLRKSLWKDKVPYFGIAAGVAVAASAAMFLFPLRDNMSATEKGPPLLLRAVVDKHRALKTEADEAGVLKESEGDMKAANLVALLDRRGVYQYITRDIQSMFESANGKTPTWATSLGGAKPVDGPAFTLTSLSTQYLAPTVVEGAADPSAMRGAGGGDGNADSLKIAAFPRIECSMLMSTAQPEPRRFAQETVERWLDANKVRKDVPYEIVFSPKPVAVSEAGKESAADPAFAVGGGGNRSFNERSNRGRSVTSGGVTSDLIYDDQGNVIGQGHARGKDIHEISPTAARGSRGGGGGGGGGGGADQTPDARLANAQAEVEKVAPFDDAQAKAGKIETGTVQVKWYVVFKPPTPTPEGDAAANTGGKK